MSKGNCDHHKHRWRELLRRICGGILIFLFIVLLVILITWAVLRPHKPSFILQDATIFAFNLSTGRNMLTSTFQVTIISRNPNDRIGIYYDRLLIYATYHTQQITLPTSIPPTFQGTNGQNIWSPFVMGKSVPIASFIGLWMYQDKTAGGLMMNFKMDGRVRWKVGAFVSGSYRLHINCPAFLFVGSPGDGIIVGNNAIKFSVDGSCTVSL